jgi:exodeoxyribonuclease (lambda-induced)
MTLIVHPAPQGSEEWIEARRGVITASKFSVAKDIKKNGEFGSEFLGYAHDIARERCGGIAPSKYQNAAMRTGTEEEPKARIAYEAETGNIVTQTGFITTSDRMFGVSVDGLIDDDGAIEIKTMVSSKTLFTAFVMNDFSQYLDQCYGAMWLLGLKWVDLVLWAPDLEPQIKIHRIARDEEKIADLELHLLKLRDQVMNFQARLQQALDS